MRGSLAPGTGEQPSVVLETTGPLPARDWQGEAGGSSKAAVSTGGAPQEGPQRAGRGTVHLGCGSWGWVGAMHLSCSGAKI